MKKLFFSMFVSVSLFSGCASHSAYTGNLNTHQTNVELSSNNFKVVNEVSGSATATYVFGIGGLSKKSLVQVARQEMLSKADLVGGSKALVNETLDTKTSFFFLFWKKKVNTSAHVVEFTN